MDIPAEPRPLPPKPSAGVPARVPEDSTLEGWGRLPVPGYEVRGEDLERLTQGATLSRGLGRSYGDSALPAPGERAVVGTVLADRILAFDPQTGILRAEAGLSLNTLIALLLPRGFFPPVTPGTKFVTLGGAVASDVHGKNHHVDGTFGNHVTALKMRIADGRILECTPTQYEDLFWATIGGMGLTGHILEVEVKLAKVPSPWIWGESERIPDIRTFMRRLDETAKTWPMTMGWVDCLSRGKKMGRGTLFAGRWATPQEAPARFPRPKPRLSVPFVFPGFLMNNFTMKVFNSVIYWKHWRRKKVGIVHPETFFWPLDAIHHWNRGYGPRGFTQHQCVLPKSGGQDVAVRFLDLLTSRGGASFLCVIKDCGAEGKGILSFPKPGISIALDIPVRDDTQALIDTLNEFVIAEGGRIYLTKDAFTRADHFAAMEPRLERFAQVRRKWDPDGRFRSAQSVRILGD